LESFLTWDRGAANRFPALFVCVGVIQGVKVERNNPQNRLKFHQTNFGGTLETASAFKPVQTLY
jgi:hypothetical protein